MALGERRERGERRADRSRGDREPPKQVPDPVSKLDALLSDRLDRGLDPEQGILFCIDGAKALRKAIGDVFGARAPVQRCIATRSATCSITSTSRSGRWCGLDCAAPGPSPTIAWRIERLKALARELERSDPGAASSLREGESMIEIVRRTQRNVKRWRDGDLRLRWSAAGMAEAERQFRKIIGYRDLANLAVAVEREVSRSLPSPPAAASRKEVVETATV